MFVAQSGAEQVDGRRWDVVAGVRVGGVAAGSLGGDPGDVDAGVCSVATRRGSPGRTSEAIASTDASSSRWNGPEVKLAVASPPVARKARLDMPPEATVSAAQLEGTNTTSPAMTGGIVDAARPATAARAW
jgi:hypothetical protein